MIAIIDYKMGNLSSVAKAFEAVGARVEVTASPALLRKAKALVLPGVGAFAAGMRNLKKAGLDREIYRAVDTEKLFLGICLGMQLLFTESQEHGLNKGLSLISGRVVRFKSDLKIPQMGWNTIQRTEDRGQRTEKNILAGIPENSYFYFVHSYYAKPSNKNFIIAASEYGNRFAAVVKKDNIFGIQFHPEKSSDLGLKILENFCKIAGEIS